MKIKRLLVATPQGASGALDKESRFVFNYDTAERACEVSLAMPIRAESYASSTLLTPFAMNKPEGWLYQQIVGRMAKFEQVDDMRLLAIIGSNQIGRLSFALPDAPRPSTRAQIGLKELLKQAPTKALFDSLVELYFESGISGVQPKVMLPDADKLVLSVLPRQNKFELSASPRQNKSRRTGDTEDKSRRTGDTEDKSRRTGDTEDKSRRTGDTEDNTPTSRATVLQHDLIVKSGGRDYPHLTENEFLCMDAARRAGIRVPNFWLSEDNGLFVMERFDLQSNPQANQQAGAGSEYNAKQVGVGYFAKAKQLGFEDMSVLMDKSPDAQGHYKYLGSYENIVRVIRAYCRGGEGLASSQRFFEYLALCVMVRNGDAHLKNFGLLYEHPSAETSPTLAPLYDVVTTTVYRYRDYRSERPLIDRTLALKLNKEKRYPSRLELLKFGADVCHVRDPAQVIERIASAMSATLLAHRDRIDGSFLQQLTREWDGGRLAVS
jgi:serine/threonine-protein kinase HipA